MRLIFLILAGLCAVVTLAQSNLGSASGVVTDSQGAVIHGAKVPRPENLWVPPVSWKYGRHSNRIGKPQCFNGFSVALNMLRPAFWSPRNRPGISRSRSSFQRACGGGGSLATGVHLGDHLRTAQRSRRTIAISGKFCSVSF